MGVRVTLLRGQESDRGVAFVLQFPIYEVGMIALPRLLRVL